MTHPNVSPEAPPVEWIDRAPADLVVGDRIADVYLPGWGVGPGEVLFLRRYEKHGDHFVSVFFVQADQHHGSETFLANGGKLRVRPSSQCPLCDEIDS